MNSTALSSRTFNDELNKALLAAICRQDAEDVRLQLSKGASPNAKEETKTGRRALHIAVGFRHDMGILSLLLSAGARLNATDAKGNTPLQLATQAGSAWAVRLLLAAGANGIDSARHQGNHPPLQEAQKQLREERSHRRAELMRMLSRQSESLSPSDADLQRKLMTAITHGNLPDIRRLLKKGVPLNALCPIRLEAPLHLAVNKGDMRVLRLLLDAGADVNQFSSYGRTPLMRAMGKGSAVIVSALLNAGADANLRDFKGLRVLDYCKDAECRRLLIRHGAMRGKENASTDADAGNSSLKNNH